MGCYNCGSEEGTSTKLCPKCIAAKNSSMQAKMEALASRRQPGISSSKLVTTVAGSALGAALLICVGFYVLFSDNGPGIALPKYVKVQNLCKRVVEKETSKIKDDPSMDVAKVKAEMKGELADLGAGMAEGMKDMAVAMVEGMSGALCEMEVSECKKEPASCDKIIERLENELKK